VSFVVAACTGCGLAAWPRPAMCRRCGSLRFGSVAAPDGVLEEVAGGLGTVRVGAGPVVVARVEGAAPGDAVALEVRDGVLIARRP
jgi:hypothetical protein